MKHLYDKNGLVFWTGEEISARSEMVDRITRVIQANLKSQNRSFEFRQIEAPQITPLERINPNYTEDDVYRIADDVVLRPETTMGTYAYAEHVLASSELRLPMVIWQHGKSFRREQDQVTKNMRLKEFYQLEFQIIFSPSTMNDYSVKLLPDLKRTIELYIGPCVLEPSDRLPSYAKWTKDIIRKENNMEVCSVSLREDFPSAKVLEVSIGTCRLVYSHFQMMQT